MKEDRDFDGGTRRVERESKTKLLNMEIKNHDQTI